MNKNNSSTNQTRRSFVKNSSLLAGGLLAAPLLSKANYFSGADDTIKIALIGCGGRGTGAATQALSTKQNVKLVAMADAFRDRLDKSYKSISGEIDAKRIDVPEDRKFVGFDAYAQAIPLADVVILATPPGFRPIHFAEAVKWGKHVFNFQINGINEAVNASFNKSPIINGVKPQAIIGWSHPYN